jgi:hypothetical protein
MKRAIVVKGRVVGPRLIELEETVEGVESDVEVVLREAVPPAAAAAEDDPESLVAVLHREDIDAALAGDRVEVQVVYKPPPPSSSVAGEEVTESPVMVARRNPSSARIRTPR